MTTTRSIDAAASGYVRHRFVRALCASFVVGTIFSFIAITVSTMITNTSTGDVAALIGAPIGAVLAIVILLLPLVVIVGLIGAIIDVLHRRLIGLLEFGFGAVAVLFAAAGAGMGVLMLAGAVAPTQDMPLRDAPWVASFGVITALIAYEVMRHGWWQLTVRTENFRAARGWRPPIWRLITTFRRHLGLPSFLSYVGRKRMVASLLYFCVAVLNLGLALLLVLPPLIATAAEQDQDPTVAYSIMGVLLLLNLIGAGGLIAKLADGRTTKLYQNVREWDARAPIVFLRAFDQDDNKLRARGGDPFARWPAGVGRPRTLDEILLEHGSPYGPVIAIGDPRDPTPPLGAARVFVEGEGAEWQGVVRGLAGASRAVVMCPNTGEGVQWELDLIAQAGGRLQTIFLASPDLDRAANLALFQRLVPNVPEIDAKQLPIAAYELGGEWQVLTAKRASVESYTAALNTALQALFGMKGEAVKRPNAGTRAVRA